MSLSIGYSEIHIFEKVFLTAFSKEFTDQHYTFDMFTNLVRPLNTQDNRVSESYWKKKAAVGQECLDIWNIILSKYNGNPKTVEMEVNRLVKRLAQWYNQESARGLTRNPNSRGSNAPIKRVPDIAFLNRVCPEFSPWNEKECRQLWETEKTDNDIVKTMKKAFSDAYIKKDENALSLWSKERKLFYTKRDGILRFLTSQGIDVSNKKEVCKILKISDNYDSDLRSKFDISIM